MAFQSGQSEIVANSTLSSSTVSSQAHQSLIGSHFVVNYPNKRSVLYSPARLSRMRYTHIPNPSPNPSQVPTPLPCAMDTPDPDDESLIQQRTFADSSVFAFGSIYQGSSSSTSSFGITGSNQSFRMPFMHQEFSSTEDIMP